MEATGTIPPKLNLLTRRPFLSAAIALILGVLCHAAAPHAPRVWLALAGAGAVLALAFWRRAVLSMLSLVISIALVGVGVAQIARFQFPDDDIAAFTADQPRLAEVELVLDQPPRVLSSSATGGRPLPPRQVTSGKVTRVRTWDGWTAASGRLLVSIDQPNPSLAYGQRVVATGTLSRPAPAMNPGQFDWARYYRQERALASLDAPHAANVRIVEEGAAWWPGRAVNWLREKARSALSRGFDQDRSLDHALLRALLLGDHDPQLTDVHDDFRKTGTSHHLAISGMHVAILGAFVFLLCRLVRFSPRKAASVMMAFVVLYGVVALPSPPVVRSIVLCVAFGIGVMLRRSVDGVQLLALTACGLVVWNPLDVYDAGCQLSFGTVLGLMTLATPLAKSWHREDEDERVLRSLGVAPGWFESGRAWVWRNFLAALAAGVVAWAISAPLIVQHFDQLSPYAVLASLILAIPVLAALVLGLVKVVLTLILPWLAPLWAELAAWPVALMRWTVDALAALPGGDLAFPALPTIAVVAFYVVFVLAVLPAVRGRLRVLARGGLATACAALVILPFVAGPGAARDGGDHLRLTLLSVGAGQCAVVELPSGKTVLIDAGSSTFAELSRRCVEPFLRKRGIRAVEAIYVSHANADHFSAVPRAAREYGVKHVAITGAFDAHAGRNGFARQVLDDVADSGIEVRRVTAGQSIRLDELTQLEVLWPPAGVGEGLSANDSSQVLKLTCGGRSILFTGDVQQAALEALLRSKGEALRADVLIAPHHGSAEDATGGFLDAVGASTILASSDRTPSRKQREFDALVTKRSQTLLRTGECGAITVRVGKDGTVRVETFLKR
jgi:competence protein ComEC